MSSESIEVPDGQPWIDRSPLISRSGETSIGSAEAPTTTSSPSTPSPPSAAVIALALVRGREDDARAAELGAARPPTFWVAAVDVVVRAELPGERLLVGAARDRDGAEAHLRGELHAEMAEAADAEDGDQVARPRAAVAQRVEGGDAGAQQRRRLGRLSSVGDARQRLAGAIM